MKKYLVIETDSADASYAYVDLCNTKEQAVKRLRDMYHQLVLGDIDTVKTAALNDEKASVETNDGVTICWQIQELEIDAGDDNQ